MEASILTAYLAEVREKVLGEIQSIVPSKRYGPILYDLMLKYPLRSAKGLRPALCIATCRALGGRLEDVVRTAAVIELYHNAFLIHDDIEDGSLMRRGFPTLHREYGIPIAVNVGDAMLALALKPLLDNTHLLGLGKALRILEIVAKMALESAEGQALELDWVRHARWELRDVDYWHLVYKKTCWYTFIAPMLIGGIVVGVDQRKLAHLRRFAIYLGVAFQIQDDLLNLTAAESEYGKDSAGDLVEGKRTLMLMHMMRTACCCDRARAQEILAKPAAEKTFQEVAWLRECLVRYGSIDYARDFAQRTAERARSVLSGTRDWMPPSTHLDCMKELVGFVVERRC